MQAEMTKPPGYEKNAPVSNQAGDTSTGSSLKKDQG